MNNNGLNGERYNSDQLTAALVEVWDLFDRALCPFVVLRDLALQLSQGEKPHDLEAISVGVLEKHLTNEVATVFKEMATDVAIKNDLKNGGKPHAIRFMAHKVPVIVTVIKRHFSVVENPDTVTHLIEDFKIPNPFSEYWKVRFFIR